MSPKFSRRVQHPRSKHFGQVKSTVSKLNCVTKRGMTRSGDSGNYHPIMGALETLHPTSLPSVPSEIGDDRLQGDSLFLTKIDDASIRCLIALIGVLGA
jgi:hypothetical protein